MLMNLRHALMIAAAASFAVFAAVDDGGTTTTQGSFSKDSFAFPDDPFINVPNATTLPSWIKFTILLDERQEPTALHFQDSNAFEFHYHFATTVLEPFIGFTQEQFDAVTLHADGQQAVLGAVLLPPVSVAAQTPDGVLYEAGIQLVRSDGYSAAEVIQYFNLVADAIESDEPLQVLYMPTFEQQAAADAAQAELAQAGITISSVERWISGDVCYSNGWAVGTLKFVEHDQITQAFLSGTLTTSDILLTNGIPAEIPPLAGVLTLAPATPNSHVAILSQTFNVPFVYFAQPQDQQRAEDLVGRLVMLESPLEQFSNVCRTRLLDVQDAFSTELLEEVLALKQPDPLDISPVEPFEAYSSSVQNLTPTDIKNFGGKASNFGFLRRAIPDNCHVAQAISFDLWTEFLDQVLPSGLTLREEIDAILAPHAAGGWPPQDITALSAALASIRAMFRDTDLTHFSPEAEDAIIATLQDPQFGLLPDWKIRFRSSTNVEDTSQFTGAGLYSSNSGCLLDDLDEDFQGPSHCDPTQPNARGVFRAIRRVFESFYFDNAYLARLQYSVDDDEAGMAMLVHHSFPDEFEMANGVIVYRRSPFSFFDEVHIVTQLGAESVTNPDPGSIPEEVVAQLTPTSILSLNVRTPSNHVILGETVMNWTADYVELLQHVRAVANRIELETGKTAFVLDFEFKKTGPGYLLSTEEKIWVTQVREIPQPDFTPTVPPLLISDTEPMCIVQAEFTDPFANQLLNSTLVAGTTSGWLTNDVLEKGFVNTFTYTYSDECGVQSFDGPVESLPEFAYQLLDGQPELNLADQPQYSWRFEDEVTNPRTYRLTISGIPALVSPQISPFRTMADFQVTLEAVFDDLVPTLPPFGESSAFTHELTAQLSRCPGPEQQQDAQERVIEDQGVTITTRYWWPVPPPDAIIIWTAPLTGWIETTIEGLTSEPIVLTSDSAQAYTPGHHNFIEWFVFEPAVDPSVPIELLDELRAADVRLIFATYSTEFGTPSITTFGFSDVPCIVPNPADLDGNGVVNVFDLLILLAAWGECPPVELDDCPADLDGNGVVNVFDLLELLANWG